MNVVDTDAPPAVSAGAEAEPLRRYAALALRVLGAQSAAIRTSGPTGSPLVYRVGQSEPDRAEEEATGPAMVQLDMPLRGSDDEAVLGTIVVADSAARVWTDEDRDALAEIAGCAAGLVRAQQQGSTVDGAPAVLSVGDGVEDEHRLITSLHSIVGFVETLKSGERGLAAYAETMRATAEAMLTVIEDQQAAARSDLDDTDAEPAATEAAADESAHILIADDLDLNRKLISDMLSVEGHVVDSVPDGASAVKAAGENSYDLILMDMIMPGMDGVAATRAIRALPAPACHVPIVALTAHSLPEQLDSCIRAGMNATLTKPMSMDALTDAVATWKRRRRQAA